MILLISCCSGRQSSRGRRHSRHGRHDQNNGHAGSCDGARQALRLDFPGRLKRQERDECCKHNPSPRLHAMGKHCSTGLLSADSYVPLTTCLLCNHVAEAGEAGVLRGRRNPSEVPRSPRRLGEPCRRAKIGESLATCQRPSGRPDLQSGCVATSRPHAGCSALVAVLVPCHASLEAWVSQMGRFAGASNTYCTLTRRIACLKKILMRCDRDCSAATGRASSEHWILP